MLLMGQGGGYSTTSNSLHFMAVSLLKMHQIFMLTFAGLRVEGEVAQVLVVSQPPPLACVAHNIFGVTPVGSAGLLPLVPSRGVARRGLSGVW